ALAAAGQGEDAGQLGNSERLALRRQALTWLRADLALWTRQLASGEIGRSRLVRVLKSWQKEADLASLRDPAAVAQLPPGEKQACKQFWADVQALRSKADAAEKAQ